MFPHFKLVTAFGLTVVLASADAHAKASFMAKPAMIKSATVIAVVEITGVEQVSIKGPHWTYGQKAMAKVEMVLKGTLPMTVALMGDEDFICARCHFEAGRYIVFLNRDPKTGFLTGANWQLSTRKITGASVEWFADDTDPFKSHAVELQDAVKEIGKRVAEQLPPSK